MIVKLRLPRTLLWVLNVFIIYALLFTGFRLLTFLLFKPDEAMEDVLSAFLLGFRFDLRWISLLLLPIVATSTVQRFSPYYSVANKKLWSWYLALSTFFVFLIYAIDYGCFAYFGVRLGATVLNFADDTVIAVQMLWEMYPLFWMIAGLITLVLLLRYLFQYLHGKVAAATTDVPSQRNWLVATLVLLSFFVYGSLPGPLQWDKAFQQKNDFSGYLSLNPLQSVYSTLHFRKPHVDEHKTKNAYPVLQQWMAWDSTAGTYRRSVQPATSYFNQKPNVVLVVCESFSMYKSSMSGNKLNTTPYFQTLADSGVFFNRCFSPHFSTARGMFAILTGIPDVQLAKFSTRTEAGKNQHTIINNFDGYNRFYFLGGSPAFNNFEGLLQNVSGVQMMTEGDFVSKPIDVWGISDKALFLEANKTFAQQKAPFFAIIQTADNHPPYTIAEEDKDFVRKALSEEALAANGFTSVEEYNAMRYFDYSVEKFMEAAKKEAYFQNTLFVFIGDHGVAGNATAVYQPAWTENRITEMHIPLLFYAPGHLPAQKRSEVVSQIDVLPSIAGIVGQKHINSTLGRDVVTQKNNHSAFFIRHDEGEIGLLTDDFYFTKNILFEKESLQLLNGKAAYSRTQQDSLHKQYSALTSAYLETARWMLLNNKSKP